MRFIKNKHIVGVIISGAILWLVGAWAKITHQSYANAVVTISHAVMITGCIILLVKVLLNNKDRFLNQ